MKKCILLCIVVAILSFPLIAEESAVPGSVIVHTPTGLHFGILTQSKELLHTLGQPDNTEHDEWNIPGMSWDVGLSLKLAADGEIYAIEISSNLFSTERGSKVGDTFASILAKYGKPNFQFSDEISYWLDEVSGWVINFQFKNGRVSKIYLGFAG